MGDTFTGGDYGFYGKGFDGYVHYNLAVNSTIKGGGGGTGPHKRESGCLTLVIVVVVILILFSSGII